MPFGDLAWRHARAVLAERGQDKVTDAETAQAAATLLDRAEHGLDTPSHDKPARPAKRDRWVVGRTKAGSR